MANQLHVPCSLIGRSDTRVSKNLEGPHRPSLHERLNRTRKMLAIVGCIDAHTRDVAPEKLPALLRSLTDEQWVAIARHARHADGSEVRPPSEVTKGELIGFYESRARRVA